MMTVQEQKAILHTIRPTIKEIKVTEIQDQLATAILSAYMIRGISNVDGSQVALNAKILTSDVVDNFKGFRLSEIVMVIENGAKGMYERDGDLTTVSVELILKWIRRYAETVRKEAMHKQKVYEEKLNLIASEEEKNNGKIVLRNAINELYVWFLQGGIIEERLNYTPNPNHLCGVYFSFLEKEGIIMMSNDHKQMILDIAKGKVSEEVPESSDRTAYKKFFETRESQEKSMARKIGLLQFFGECKAKGVKSIFEQ